LTESLIFTDALGREHSGQPGDYLVESPEGLRCIRPRALFENIYVPLRGSPVSRPTARGFSDPDVISSSGPPEHLPAPALSG
jgi:hypothetical protein